MLPIYKGPFYEFRELYLIWIDDITCRTQFSSPKNENVKIYSHVQIDTES